MLFQVRLINDALSNTLAAIETVWICCQFAVLLTYRPVTQFMVLKGMSVLSVYGLGGNEVSLAEVNIPFQQIQSVCGLNTLWIHEGREGHNPI